VAHGESFRVQMACIDQLTDELELTQVSSNRCDRQPHTREPTFVLGYNIVVSHADMADALQRLLCRDC